MSSSHAFSCTTQRGQRGLSPFLSRALVLSPFDPPGPRAEVSAVARHRPRCAAQGLQGATRGAGRRAGRRAASRLERNKGLEIRTEAADMRRVVVFFSGGEPLVVL